MFTDASNVGWVAHLNQYSIKGLWSDLEKSLHTNVLELKAVFLALKHFRLQCQNQTVLVATDSSLHQQTGRDSLSRDVRPSMEDHELVSSIQNISTCQTHSIVPKCHRGPPVQINSNSVNRVVSTPSGVQKNLHKVVHTSGGSVCHSAKPQVATICLSSSRSKCMEHRCSKHRLVKPCSLCLPSNSSTSKSNTKGPPAQLPPNPGLATHALVLGSGPSIRGNSTSVACISKSTQAGVSQQSAISQPPCLVSRSEQFQQQDFSSEVVERIAAPQRSSTRSIYQARWTLFEKWC